MGKCPEVGAMDNTLWRCCLVAIRVGSSPGCWNHAPTGGQECFCEWMGGSNLRSQRAAGTGLLGFAEMLASEGTRR